MLHQKITEKGVMRTVACLLEDDLRQELGIYGSYTVEKRVYDNNAQVLVYSDQTCNIISASCVEDVMGVITVYKHQYGRSLSWHFGTTKIGEGDDERILPCVLVNIMVVSGSGV